MPEIVTAKPHHQYMVKRKTQRAGQGIEGLLRAAAAITGTENKVSLWTFKKQ